MFHVAVCGTDVRILMPIGGWLNYDVIEPYIGEPTEAKVG